MFSELVSNNPHLVIHVGDMHNAGMGGGNSNLFQRAYHEVFKSKQMRDLFENHNMAYVFDDKDVGAEDSDGLNHSTREANIAYRNVFPHYDLAVKNGTRGIW